MLSQRPLKRGIEAGLMASVPQVLLAKAEEKLLMSRGEDADLGPRFVDRLADMAGMRLNKDMRWLSRWTVPEDPDMSRSPDRCTSRVSPACPSLPFTSRRRIFGR